MKPTSILGLVLGAVVSAQALGAAEPEDPAPPTNRPSPEVLRQRARTVSPEEMETRRREMRARLGPGITNRTELEKRRDEWRKLPPAEREARVREFRERAQADRVPPFATLTPAEREAKRKEITGRITSQIRELETRKAGGGVLTPQEERRLERFRQMARRLERGTALGVPPKNTPANP